MNNTKVLTIGGSRNIGYLSSIRLLDLGATVTFLLRTPKTIQKYVRMGKARLVQGDALIKDDVERAWAEAAKGDDDTPVEFLIFTVGSTSPQFVLSKGFVISPPDLVTRALMNCLETLPSPTTKIITISSSGLTHTSSKKLPLLMRPLYRYLASSVVLRPAFLTNGECRGEKPSSVGKKGYRVAEWDVDRSWTVSRSDVAHFLVEGVVKHWDEWEGKCLGIGY
ncbi:hypothetical protein BU15DRAFT_87000 [Melanogaster broomeanus]|nr:hypothetical protein BU15DRAFT_87000 [Melanogaster broomeanus]